MITKRDLIILLVAFLLGTACCFSIFKICKSGSDINDIQVSMIDSLNRDALKKDSIIFSLEKDIKEGSKKNDSLVGKIIYVKIKAREKIRAIDSLDANELYGFFCGIKTQTFW